jgi:hypothetical protein
VNERILEDEDQMRVTKKKQEFLPSTTTYEITRVAERREKSLQVD